MDVKNIMDSIYLEYPDLETQNHNNSLYMIMKNFLATGLAEYIPVYKGAYKWIGPQGMIDKL